MSELSFFGGYGPTQFFTLVSAGIFMYARYLHLCRRLVALVYQESYPQQFYGINCKHIKFGEMPQGLDVSARQITAYVG